MTSDAAERSQRARIAALTRVTQEPSGTAMTEKARSKFWQSFYDATDPSLPEAERQRQADAARRLHMTRLSQKAALKRQRAAAAITEAIRAEAALKRQRAAAAITEAIRAEAELIAADGDAV
jgi:hypothetical protein